MIRFLRNSLTPLLGLAAAPAAARPALDQAEFDILPARLQEWLESVRVLPGTLGFVLAVVAVLTLGRKMRLNRRALRQMVLGLENGPRFRAVDAMCHAVWKGRRIDPERLKRALEIARATTDMNFTADHIREAAKRADRIIIPVNFHWMRDGLTHEEKMVIFNATLSVLVADSPLTTPDRAFLAVLARGLGLKRKDLRSLGALLPA